MIELVGEHRTINLELCCPVTNVSLHRRRSRSGTPRRYRSRTPTLRRGRSPSPTAKRHKRQRSRSSSLSPLPKSRSPSLTSTERKNALQKLRKEEEVKKRNQQEVEMKQLEEETARRMEEAIRIKVDKMLSSEEIKLETERRIQEGRKKLFDDVEAQLWKEKEAALIEARRKEKSCSSCDSTLAGLTTCGEKSVDIVEDMNSSKPSCAAMGHWCWINWKTAGGIRVSDLDFSSFIFDFLSLEEATRILEEKKWFLYGTQEQLYSWIDGNLWWVVTEQLYAKISVD
ncbi:hypothetical protein RJ639_046711 [Escallonia herrerae]|uniref:DUF4283 domain-containing protein n=1 Tax=Escallonia herrerae TaxID=1293975 RepID=A0AA88W7F4_9ASTE|nr:hypothetical protein RJ639_046711 [Escallonia herrerae]